MKSNNVASFILILLFAVGFGACGPGGTNDPAATSTPVSEVDMRINDYEKAANEYLRLSKKHTTGDVSITVLLIQARKNLQDKSAKVQEFSAKMTPPQNQRVAAISAKAAPNL